MISETLDIPVKQVRLKGIFEGPKEMESLVVFAHGSGSGRLSPRNQQVAKALNDLGIATCLFDLLTAEEEALDRETGVLRFNIPLLTHRLVNVTDWLSSKYSKKKQPIKIGYFGASTGSAAALMAATQCKTPISAFVSRGGRVDLAGEMLSKITSPSLFIVGELDTDVLELNRAAFQALRCEKELVVVPNASHLFEEPGTLEEVMYLAGRWFSLYL